MIIYNSNKKFIGIDDSDLKTLGFKNLADLQSEAADFADLFVKTPGHVHNFKNVHWIDFVLCAKSAQESKAIIHTNNQNFKLNLEVKTIYLSDAPSTPAFSISLNNIRSLSNDEKTKIVDELEVRTAPAVENSTPTKEVLSDEDIGVILDDLHSDTCDILHDPYAVVDDKDSAEITQDELEYTVQEDDVEIQDMYEDEVQNEEAEEYVFDSQKTAEALEMPVSLIEEFIEDFISQAKEFKDAIYNSVAQEDMEELQSYSHKLKGVAANLRVNNALEVLTKINQAKDFSTSKKDLDSFYNIISKLSGEKTKNQNPPIEQQSHAPIIENISITEDDELLEIAEDDDSIEIKLDEDDEEIVISDDFDILDDAMNQIIQESDLYSEDEDLIPEIKTQAYSRTSAANEIGIDEESFSELFNDYIDDSQNLIHSIEEAINDNNPSAWREAAIKLKGMSDNMRIKSFITDLEVLITTKVTNDAHNALEHIQTIMFEILETKD